MPSLFLAALLLRIITAKGQDYLKGGVVNSSIFLFKIQLVIALHIVHDYYFLSEQYCYCF
jgi:hypothetical protein